jgi:3-hydroxyisobutyrate dehydrogenase
MKERIGFIGVGVMGKPMALNLLKAGYPLTVFDLNPSPLKELQAKGAAIGQSSKEVASQAQVVITMLPNSGDVEKVILKENGVIEGLKSNSIVVDMSTIDPSVSKSIAKTLAGKNIKMLDAPVSGGQKGAEDGTLSIMVGGDKDVFEACSPLFKAMGQNIFYCGPNGTGEIVKIVNNLLAATNRAVSAEGLALGVKAGADFKVLYDVICTSTGQSRSLQFTSAGKPFKGDYEPGFAAELMHKDLGLAMNLAKEEKVPVPLGAISHQIYNHLLASGLGKKDTGIVFKVYEDLLKVKLRF